MTARKADPRVERWAQSAADFAVDGETADSFARRIVRAIDRARREERKAAAGRVAHYLVNVQNGACYLNGARRAILGSPAGARERGKR